MKTEMKFGWKVPEWASAAGISRSSVYELLKENSLRSVKFGGARIITTHPTEWLASLNSQVVQ